MTIKIVKKVENTYPPTERGYRAFNNGQSLVSNPYVVGGPSHTEWFNGWRNAEKTARQFARR